MRDVSGVNYGFLMHGELERERLASALAELFAVPVEAVDVGDADAVDRNWAAAVSCTVTALAGDLRWHLDVYLRDSVVNPPPEAVAAVWLARALGTVVGYEAVPDPPSAYWLVGPDGRRTRARIYEEDTGDVPAYRIDAVEQPLAALPGARVAPIPEVIRSYRMATPVTDRLREQLQTLLTAYEGGSGAVVLDPAAAAAGKAAWYAVTRLGVWEGMVTRLLEGWPPDGWYPAEYYREDLECRDEVDSVAGDLPEPARSQFGEALADVDRRFREATVPAAEPPTDRWWWSRVPDPLPWRDSSSG